MSRPPTPASALYKRILMGEDGEVKCAARGARHPNNAQTLEESAKSRPNVAGPGWAQTSGKWRSMDIDPHEHSDV